jgi:hypothetical protein
MDIVEQVYALVEALISSYRLNEADSTYLSIHADLRRGARNTEFMSNRLRFAFRVAYWSDVYRYVDKVYKSIPHPAKCGP